MERNEEETCDFTKTAKPNPTDTPKSESSSETGMRFDLRDEANTNSLIPGGESFHSEQATRHAVDRLAHECPEMPVSDPQLETEDHLLRGIETPGYELLSLPIMGGMGCVYRAWNRKLERVVAIKISRNKIDSGSNSSSESQANCDVRQEAALLARINHPAIAACYGYDQFDQHSFFEMEWINGVTLDDLVKHVESNSLQAGLGPQELIPWMKTILESLIFAQFRGVHHLDLKPQNVMLTPKHPHAESDDSPSDLKSLTTVESIRQWCQSQEIKVLDFGLARRSSDTKIEPSKRSISGTRGYLAPEQIESPTWDPILVDMHCCGGILYTCLTGLPPNQSKHFGEAVVKQDAEDFCRRETPIYLRPEVSRDLDAIAMKCLERNPKERYTSLDALYGEFQSLSRFVPILARRTGPVERSIKYVQRHPYAISLIALLVVGMGIALTLANWLFQANHQTQLARESDRASFQQAIETVVTMDQAFLRDPQLNLPINRELAIRFKATLFDLYQIFTQREHLAVEDRRRLANISSRLAMDQMVRGDYELAVNFFDTTVKQYEKLLHESSNRNSDRINELNARIELNRAKTELSREIYPADEILSDLKSLIAKAKKENHLETHLNALTSYGTINLSINNRDGAKKSLAELERAFELCAIFDPSEPEEILAKARALARMGLVFYKGGDSKFPICYLQSRKLYEEVISKDFGDSTVIAREFASLINNLGMSNATQMRNIATEWRKNPASDQLAEKHRTLKAEIEFNYLTALARIIQACEQDPLNNLFLRTRISCEWNLADFYSDNSLLDSDREFAAEIKYRNLCMEHATELAKRQPKSTAAGDILAIQAFRLAICFRSKGDVDGAQRWLGETLTNEEWRRLRWFEVNDQTRLAMSLLTMTASHKDEIGLSDSDIKQALKLILEKFQSIGFSKSNRLTIANCPHLDENLTQLDSLDEECRRLAKSLVELINFE